MKSTLSESSQDSLGWVYPPAVSPSTPLTTFLALTDTPNSYAGKAGDVVAVKANETGLEFVTQEPGMELLGGTTSLIEDQEYIEVTFTEAQDSADWILASCSIVNETDPTPLNIVPGVITSKTTTGFRLELVGVPDSENYVLYWALGTDTGTSGGGGGGGGSGLGDVINVLDYGAVADCVTLLDITMPNGYDVTSAAYEFTEADIGKWAIIRGATGVMPLLGSASPLVARITAVSGHTATLDTATTSALTNVQPDSFPRMDFGTNNSIPFDLAMLAVPGPGSRNFYDSVPFAGTGVMNPIEPGDGGTVYIPRGNYLMVPSNDYGAGVNAFWWAETNNLTLKGDGMGQTVIYTTSAFTYPFICGGFAGTHGMFQNLKIMDFTMYDLNYYFGNGNTIHVEQTNNVLIERIETVNGKGNGCINYQGYGLAPVSRRLYIRDCWIHGNVEDGSSNVIFNGIEGDGMNVGQVSDVHIEGNTIETTGRHAYEGGGNCYDQYFIGNTINMANEAGTPGGASGINPTGGSRTVIMGNTIKGVGAGQFGIDLTVDIGSWFANDIRVIGNYIGGVPQAAMRFQNTSGDTTVAQHVDRIIVANNWVEPSASAPSMVGIYVGGGDATQAMSMLIEGNWFNNLGQGLASVNGLVASTGKWVIMRDNFLAGAPASDNCYNGNIIIEGNTTILDWNRYGGSPQLSNIDSQTVTTGSTYSNTSTGYGWRTTDNVEILRGATTAGGLIIWGQVTAADTVTTYAYNPTGSSLSTGTGTKFMVHRTVLP